MSDYGEPIAIVDDDRCRDIYIGDRDGNCVAIIQHFNAEKVARAVACVNACAGIRDPEKVVKAWADVVRLHGLQMDTGTFGYAVSQLVERTAKEASQ